MILIKLPATWPLWPKSDPGVPSVVQQGRQLPSPAVGAGGCFYWEASQVLNQLTGAGLLNPVSVDQVALTGAIQSVIEANRHVQAVVDDQIYGRILS